MAEEGAKLLLKIQADPQAAIAGLRLFRDELVKLDAAGKETKGTFHQFVLEQAEGVKGAASVAAGQKLTAESVRAATREIKLQTEETKASLIVEAHAERLRTQEAKTRGEAAKVITSETRAREINARALAQETRGREVNARALAQEMRAQMIASATRQRTEAQTAALIARAEREATTARERGEREATAAREKSERNSAAEARAVEKTASEKSNAVIAAEKSTAAATLKGERERTASIKREFAEFDKAQKDKTRILSAATRAAEREYDSEAKAAQKSFNDVAKEIRRLKTQQENENRQSIHQSGGQSNFGALAAGGILGGITGSIIGGVASHAIDLAGSTQESLNVFRVVAHATGEEMVGVAAKARQLGADIGLPGTNSKIAADSMLELSKAGLSVKDSMSAARGALLLADAAQVDGATAAKIVSSALNAFSLSGENAERVANLLNSAAYGSGASLTEMSDALRQTGTVAAKLGIPIEDITTAISMMAKAGLRGETGGTALRTALQRLEAPTGKASNVLKALGVEVYDASGKFVGFRKLIEELTKATAPLNEQQKNYAMTVLFGKNAVQAANVVLTEGIGKYDEMHKKLTDQNELQSVANARMDGYAGSVRALSTTFDSFLEKRAAPFLNFLSKVVSQGGEGIGILDKFIDRLDKAGSTGGSHEDGAGLRRPLDSVKALWQATKETLHSAEMDDSKKGRLADAPMFMEALRTGDTTDVMQRIRDRGLDIDAQGRQIINPDKETMRAILMEGARQSLQERAQDHIDRAKSAHPTHGIVGANADTMHRLMASYSPVAVGGGKHLNKAISDMMAGGKGHAHHGRSAADEQIRDQHKAETAMARVAHHHQHAQTEFFSAADMVRGTGIKNAGVGFEHGLNAMKDDAGDLPEIRAHRAELLKQSAALLQLQKTRIAARFALEQRHLQGETGEEYSARESEAKARRDKSLSEARQASDKRLTEIDARQVDAKKRIAKEAEETAKGVVEVAKQREEATTRVRELTKGYLESETRRLETGRKSASLADQALIEQQIHENKVRVAYIEEQAALTENIARYREEVKANAKLPGGARASANAGALNLLNSANRLAGGVRADVVATADAQVREQHEAQSRSSDSAGHAAFMEGAQGVAHLSMIQARSDGGSDRDLDYALTGYRLARRKAQGDEETSRVMGSEVRDLSISGQSDGLSKQAKAKIFSELTAIQGAAIKSGNGDLLEQTNAAMGRLKDSMKSAGQSWAEAATTALIPLLNKSGGDLIANLFKKHGRGAADTAVLHTLGRQAQAHAGQVAMDGVNKLVQKRVGDSFDSKRLEPIFKKIGDQLQKQIGAGGLEAAGKIAAAAGMIAVGADALNQAFGKGKNGKHKFGGLLGTIAGTIFGGPAGGAAGGALGGMLGFADGGQPPLGRTSVVGEFAPEIIIPRESSTVLNRKQVNAVMQAMGAAPGSALRGAAGKGGAAGASGQDGGSGGGNTVQYNHYGHNYDKSDHRSMMKDFASVVSDRLNAK